MTSQNENIPFNVAPVLGNEIEYINDVFKTRMFHGNGAYTKKCEAWLKSHLGETRSLLVPSCTHALEMAALLIDLAPGDEVIMPSFTFVSTANAMILRGAKIKFIDIRPDTLNLDETLIESAITSKTKAIIPVHYAGVACEMNTINNIASKNKLFVIEDAAQGLGSTYNGQALGTLSDMGCFSFHGSKNIVCGEGGALLLKDEKMALRAEILQEKGTNRTQFERGEVDKYSWKEIGSSYLTSEITAAFLLAQLEGSNKITTNRRAIWNQYQTQLSELENRGLLELPKIPKECEHNGHIFYLKLKDKSTRKNFLSFLNNNGISSTFHYVPLHTTKVGQKHGEFIGNDQFTSDLSDRIIRLPIWYGMTSEQIDKVIKFTLQFFN